MDCHYNFHIKNKTDGLSNLVSTSSNSTKRVSFDLGLDLCQLNSLGVLRDLESRNIVNMKSRHSFLKMEQIIYQTKKQKQKNQTWTSNVLMLHWLAQRHKEKHGSSEGFPIAQASTTVAPVVATIVRGVRRKFDVLLCQRKPDMSTNQIRK